MVNCLNALYAYFVGLLFWFFNREPEPEPEPVVKPEPEPEPVVKPELEPEPVKYFYSDF